MEQVIIKKIIGGILGLKTGTKEPKDVAFWLKKLKQINPYLFEDYLSKYKEVCENKKYKWLTNELV